MQILKFLRCEPFCCGDGDKIWKSLIQSPLEAGMKHVASNSTVGQKGIASEFISNCVEDSSLAETEDKTESVLMSNYLVDRARHLMHRILEKVRLLVVVLLL
jgi:hypothetical protein